MALENGSWKSKTEAYEVAQAMYEWVVEDLPDPKDTKVINLHPVN